MRNRNDQNEVLTEFSMEEILKVQEGVVQQYSTPMKDREGHEIGNHR